MDQGSAPTGALLVGSVPFTDAREVFQRVGAALGSHLKRIPDGETGERSNWIEWQAPLFASNPALEPAPPMPGGPPRPMAKLRDGASVDSITFAELGYAKAALASYQDFAALKSSGAIPAHCRFQVSLPTPLAPIHIYVHPSIQSAVEPIYERRLMAELDEVLAAIPHEELAIQWDTAIEFAVLERVMPSYLGDVEAGVAERMSRLCAAVPEPVELGVHLCYGDAGHQHFCEPHDMSKLVDVANSISGAAARSVQWIHMPVPRNRDDDDYFRALQNLTLRPETELYLGLVHQTDGEEGARRRIAAAQKHVSAFGVATECGFGRRPTETLDALMRLHAVLARPVTGA